jgi:hypothetical protein
MYFIFLSWVYTCKKNTPIVSALEFMEKTTNTKMVINQKIDLSSISKFHAEGTSKTVNP